MDETRAMSLLSLDLQLLVPMQGIATEDDHLNIEDAWSFSYALGRIGASVVDLTAYAE